MPKSCDNEQLKAVFIDDERLVRQLLMNCVDWDSLGFTVAGDSPGGQHALAMVGEIKPDLIFVDIYMPVMDGIELSAKILKILPQARIIIVTGHQDFEYARESIKVGVSDFLLKPINPTEIETAARKAREAILLARNEREEVAELKQRMEDHYPHLKERVLDQLLRGDHTGQTLDESLAYFDIHFEEPFFQVAVMCVDFKPHKIQDDARKKTALMTEAKQVFHDTLMRYDRVYNGSGEGGIVVLSNNSRVDLYEVLDCVKIELSEHFPCVVSVSAGLSDPCSGIAGISDACKQAQEALNYKLVCGKGHIVRYADIINEEKEFLRDDKQMDLLGFSMRSGLIQNAEDTVEKILDCLKTEEISRLEQLHGAAAKVLSECLSVMAECHIPAVEVLGHEGNPYERIFTIETLPQMKKYLRHCAGRVAGKVLESNRGKVHGIIQDVEAYIGEHITDPELSLSAVANTFYLNASYLSRIFKQETGYTFVDYIKKMRMEKVLELLTGDDLRVYQICERVGIEDPHYLSILFKKYTGITISEYKQQLKGSGE